MSSTLVVTYRCVGCQSRTYKESVIRDHVLRCSPKNPYFMKVSKELIRVEKEEG